MRRVIMLLPNPDNLQLANCHKYLTRTSNTYDAVYTMTTIKGQCHDVEKILVIGHGSKAGFVGATVAEVAQAIIDSEISMVDDHKIAFDTCWAGTKDHVHPHSALDLLKMQLRSRLLICYLQLTGGTGPTVTIGNPDDKRMVVDPAKLSHAGAVQGALTKQANVDLFGHRGDWDEAAPPSQIKSWAQAEYAKLARFATAFRTAIDGDFDKSGGRKVTINVT